MHGNTRETAHGEEMARWTGVVTCQCLVSTEQTCVVLGAVARVNVSCLDATGATPTPTLDINFYRFVGEDTHLCNRKEN